MRLALFGFLEILIVSYTTGLDHAAAKSITDIIDFGMLSRQISAS